MDSFDPEHRRLMLHLGNTRVNAAYLAHLPVTDVVPPPAKPNSTRYDYGNDGDLMYISDRYAKHGSKLNM